MNTYKNTYKDPNLSNLFQMTASRHNPPADFADRLCQTLPAQEKARHAKTRRRLISCIAAAAVFCLSIGSLYATGVFGEGGILTESTIFADYHSMPDADTLKEDLGFVPQLPKTFGPFSFQEATIGDTTYQGKDGKAELTAKELMATYADKTGQKISFFASPAVNPLTLDPEKDTAVTQNGITYQLLDYTQRVVPPDYEKTEEDLALEKAGRLNIAFGGDKISESRNATVIWQEDGIEYQLLAEDGLSSQDLLALISG